ncbi:PREDICTED: WW domain-binding [Prunus dulcis]|uniref:PREDICTED: WW domain-binding n=1 Tax=Prunus dulcis TaxID=3755 RepID=A0A5E4GI29_PRUDU|nr:PREDICTED: WW domain-binding [Prunus dulcis]
MPFTLVFYWVSQGNKWCDFCKIYISNNPSSIRNHELGQRHKDNVAKKLADMRKEKVAKEKEEKEAERALLQIEAKAKRSYQKDVASFQEARDARAFDVEDDGQEKWQYNSTSGYYYNQSNGFYYDANSGFYYSDAIGKWVAQEEAYANPQFLSNAGYKESILKRPGSTSGAGPATENKGADKSQNGPPPGPVVSASLNPMRSVKGARSSVSVGKRKRQEEKPRAISAQEAAALKAREAARKRVEEREKPLLGLYRPQ